MSGPAKCCVIAYVALGQKRLETPALELLLRRRRVACQNTLLASQ